MCLPFVFLFVGGTLWFPLFNGFKKGIWMSFAVVSPKTKLACVLGPKWLLVFVYSPFGREEEEGRTDF